jgi:hypothetical protein
MSQTHARYGDLSPARRRLADLIHHLRYGQIRCVRVVAGDPVLDPPPVIVRSLSLGAPSRIRHPPGHDTRLKPHLVALFAECDRLGTGQIEVIKVQDGLPAHAQVAVEVPPTP